MQEYLCLVFLPSLVSSSNSKFLVDLAVWFFGLLLRGCFVFVGGGGLIVDDSMA